MWTIQQYNGNYGKEFKCYYDFPYIVYSRILQFPQFASSHVMFIVFKGRSHKRILEVK